MTQSIVQGSGIEPLLHIIVAPDLDLLPQINQLCKYADNTTLIIHFSKTKESVFRHAGLRHFEDPTYW